MAQRTFHDSGHDGRSVLGMLEVQVERDPKTGATVIRSVAPVSTPGDAPSTATIFDDGRKSIHAVGQSAGQPSSEELGQILNVIDGVGMRVLLDEVAVTPDEIQIKMGDVGSSEASDRKTPTVSPKHAMSKEENSQFGRFRDDQVEVEDKCATMVVREIAEQVDHIDERRLEEGPVTLMFLGYADATSGVDGGQDDQGGVIPVERVIITEDGVELMVEPETKASAESPSKEVEDQDAKRASGAFQEVSLEVNGGGGDVQDQVPQRSSPARKAEAKPKTCQCCSVM